MRLFLLTALCFLLTVGAHAAPASTKAPYVPQETRVALLPVVTSLSGKVAEDAVSSARVSLGRQFVGHGFKVVPAPAVAAALDSAKLTLSAKAPPTPEALTKIGAAVNARLVVFVALTQPGVTVKVWVFDTKTQKFVLDGKIGMAAGRSSAEVAQVGVQVALEEFFKPYDFYDC